MYYKIATTTGFDKDYKKIKKRNKELDKLKEVVDKLSNNETLELKYKDHSLFDDGNYKGCRECHIEPDWLLIYKKNNKELILILLRTGSHSDLF